jgi:CheY-like chemotaxis protein
MTLGTAGPSRARRPVVLVAEDDDQLRRLIVRKLRRRGCEILAARNGVELAELLVVRAIEALGRHAPIGLVISDIRMPGRTGLEILDMVRGSELLVPVILITGFGDPATHAEAKRLGAMAVFDKPVDLDDLASAACAALGLPRLV